MNIYYWISILSLVSLPIIWFVIIPFLYKRDYLTATLLFASVGTGICGANVAVFYDIGNDQEKLDSLRECKVIDVSVFPGVRDRGTQEIIRYNCNGKERLSTFNIND